MSVAVTHLSRDEVNGRRLCVLDLPSITKLPRTLALPSPRFVCLIACDAGTLTPETLDNLARCLVDSGAVYVCAWGPHCERIEDAVDSLDVELHLRDESDRVIMTTSHAGEPLREAIRFALTDARPAADYDEGCEATLGLIIGNESWSTEVHNAFSNPRGFNAAVLSEDL